MAPLLSFREGHRDALSSHEEARLTLRRSPLALYELGNGHLNPLPTARQQRHRRRRTVALKEEEANLRILLQGQPWSFESHEGARTT